MFLKYVKLLQGVARPDCSIKFAKTIFAGRKFRGYNAQFSTAMMAENRFVSVFTDYKRSMGNHVPDISTGTAHKKNVAGQ